ncbi:MAG: SRPBCC domain-containing protein [Bacteroidota bacterium]
MEEQEPEKKETREEPRIDTASRLIKASPSKIYKALTTQSDLMQWKAPDGMRMEIFHYNFRVDGTYRMALYYKDRSAKGKTGGNSDIVKGKFIELVTDHKIVEAISFDSPDPTFAGELIMTTELVSEKGATRVTFTATHVPGGIAPEDHATGMNSSLENLAKFTE